MAELSFPPNITDDIEKNCIKDYIKETSLKTLETIECGICGEGVKNNPSYFEKYAHHDIPGRELLSTEHSSDYLPDYVHDDLILSPGGVESDQTVICCKKCLNHLNNEKLPPFSVANDFKLDKRKRKRGQRRDRHLHNKTDRQTNERQERV